MEKYYKQTITLEILSKDNPSDWDLIQDIFASLMSKKCSSLLKDDQVQEIDSKIMAQLLEKNGTDISFFS